VHMRVRSLKELARSPFVHMKKVSFCFANGNVGACTSV